MPVKEDLEKIFPDQIKNIGINRILLIFISVFFVVIILSIIVLASLLGSCKKAKISQTQFAALQNDFACESSQCLRSSSYMLDLMDERADPCDDFYRFACGSFGARNPLAPDEPELTMEIHMENEIETNLRRLIDDPTKYYHKTESEQKLKDFYDMCVHEYGRSKDGGSSLMTQIRSSLGGWAVVDPDSAWRTNHNLAQSIATVQGELMVNVFFSTYLERDTNINRNVLSFYRVSSSATPFALFFTNVTNAQAGYKAYIREVGTLLARDSNTSLVSAYNLDLFVSDVYSLESSIAINTRNLRGASLYKQVKTTFGELQKNFSHLAWLNVAQRMFSNLPLSMDTQVRITGVPFFQMLENALTNQSWSDIDRMLNNFFVWKIASKYAPNLSFEYKLAKSRFEEMWSGKSAWLPAWKECLDTVRERLGTLLTAEFARIHMNPESRVETHNMFLNLHSSLISKVDQIDFMDPLTKSRSRDKLNALQDMIGFAEVYHNLSAMDVLHSDLQIDRSLGFFTNLLRVLRFQRNLKTRLFSYTDEQFVKHGPIFGWDFHYWVFPYFYSTYNLVSVPAGGLVEPMFSPSRPRVFNYGYLGSVMAAEMLGTIGRKGRVVWTNNSYTSWWSNSTKSEFNKTKSCFSSFFNNRNAGPYLIEGVNLTIPVNVGRSTLEELIEEHGGTLAALRAYKQMELQYGTEKIPSGLLRYTSDQIFFIASAQTKCYSRTDELNYEDVKDGLVPEDIRLNGLLSHMDEFTTAFSCSIGSKMRSAYQCKSY